ncbi:MAG: type II secretion system protein [Candidatus Acidiferrales bacterium]
MNRTTRGGAAHRAGTAAAENGFTLLELMVVLAIFVILMTLAAGSYQRSVLHAKEAALHQDLAEMRKAIDDYTMDKEAAPNTLDDLVQAQYLHEIPADPLTRKREWNTDTCDELLSPDQTSTGICNVHSESDGVSPLENSAYSSW